MKRSIAAFIAALLLAAPAYAATVYLKSGQVVSGEIVKKTDQYVILKLYDVPITYYYDEIKRLEEDLPAGARSSQGEGARSTLLTRENLEAAFTIRPNPQENAFPPEYSDAEKPLTNTVFLWQVRTPRSTVYLLGSLHVLKRELLPLAGRIAQAFNESQTLVTEVDLDQDDQLMMRSSLMAQALYQGNESLSNHIPPDLYRRVVKKLASLGLSIDMFAKFKPWFLALQMTAIELTKMGFDPSQGIDRYFLDKAKGKKKILELEAYDFQVTLLSGLSEAQQVLLLESALMDLETLEREMDRLIESWISGDAATVEKLVFGNLKSHPELEPVYDKLFFERNAAMAAKIEAMMKAGGSYFVIVGAGHLVGEKGIIRLLKDRGFSVQQM